MGEEQAVELLDGCMLFKVALGLFYGVFCWYLMAEMECGSLSLHCRQPTI